MWWSSIQLWCSTWPWFALDLLHFSWRHPWPCFGDFEPLLIVCWYRRLQTFQSFQCSIWLCLPRSSWPLSTLVSSCSRWRHALGWPWSVLFCAQLSFAATSKFLCWRHELDDLGYQSYPLRLSPFCFVIRLPVSFHVGGVADVLCNFDSFVDRETHFSLHQHGRFWSNKRQNIPTDFGHWCNIRFSVVTVLISLNRSDFMSEFGLKQNSHDRWH